MLAAQLPSFIKCFHPNPSIRNAFCFCWAAKINILYHFPCLPCKKMKGIMIHLFFTKRGKNIVESGELSTIDFSACLCVQLAKHAES